MDFAHYWFGGGGSAPADIGNSLRFRGAQRLSRTLSCNQVRTFSFWHKYAADAPNRYLYAHGSSNYLATRSGGDPTPNSWQTLNQGSAFTQIYRDGVKFRDPAAWSHFVFECTDSDVTLYINGEEWGNAGGPNIALTNELFEIGSRGNAEFYNGYMAEWHFVDGQAFGPEVFGEFNGQGVWVPRNAEVITAELNDLVLAPFPANAVDLVDGWDANSTNPDACWSNNYNNANSVTGNSGVTNWTGSLPLPAGTTRVEMKIGSGGGSWSPASGHVLVNGTDVSGRFPVGGTLNPAVADITDVCGNEITSIRLSSTPSVSNTAFYGIKFNGRIVQTDQNRTVYPEGATPRFLSTGWTFTGNGGNPKNTFNGDLQSGTGSSSGTCTWAGNIPVPAGAQVFVHAGSGGGSGSNEAFQINGNQYGNRVPSPFVGITRIEVTDLVTTGAITQLFLRGTPGVVNSVLTGIEIVDGGVSNLVVEPLSPYGEGGFHLDFSDPNNIGADDSGNMNDFTPAGFELANTSSTLYDSMEDSPTNNFATNNPVFPDAGTVSEPLIEANLAKNNYQTRGAATIALPPGGAYYMELQNRYTTSPHQGCEIRIIDAADPGNYYGKSYIFYNSTRRVGKFTGGETTVADPPGVTLGANSYLQVAVDRDNGRVWYGVNNQWYDTATTTNGDPAAGTNPSDDTLPLDGLLMLKPTSNASPGYNSGYWVNYGQRPFNFTPPEGFAPMSTAALPDVAIRNPSEHFRTILDTGANILGSAQAAFPAGLWWIKDRTQNSQHLLVDSVRGGNLALDTPAQGAEHAYSAPGGNSVAWCWNLVNDRSNGFDIVTYTGTGSARTVAHNLGEVPEYIITRKRNNGGDYFISYHVTPGPQYGTQLNSYQSTSNQAFWNNTAPTSTVFTVGTENSTNASGAAYVAYLWRSIPGFSAMGGYQGNGADDGVFIYLGFRPAYVYIKNWGSPGTEAGIIYDSTRSTYNPNDTTLFPQNEWSESYINSVYSQPIDMLSNGFKIRGRESRYNNSSYKYFYVAFAEHPMGGGNVAPSPAR